MVTSHVANGSSHYTWSMIGYATCGQR